MENLVMMANIKLCEDINLVIKTFWFRNFFISVGGRGVVVAVIVW